MVAGSTLGVASKSQPQNVSARIAGGAILTLGKVLTIRCMGHSDSTVQDGGQGWKVGALASLTGLELREHWSSVRHFSLKRMG